MYTIYFILYKMIIITIDHIEHWEDIKNISYIFKKIETITNRYNFWRICFWDRDKMNHITKACSSYITQCKPRKDISKKRQHNFALIKKWEEIEWYTNWLWHWDVLLPLYSNDIDNFEKLAQEHIYL